MAKVIAAKVSDINAGSLYKASVEGHDITLTNIDGKFYAIDDTCTHAGASISEGTIEGNTIRCGWHKAEFDCTSGKLVKFPATIKDLKSYPVSIEGDNVLVEI